MSRSPFGRRPSRVAVMICSSVHLPIPVVGSGVMFEAYTVPNGPSYLRPPALRGCFGAVWQPQPAAAPNTYLPRAICSRVGWAAASEATAIRNRTDR